MERKYQEQVRLILRIAPEITRIEEFLFCLFSSKRPIIEILNPNFSVDYKVFENQFNGMTSEVFDYEMFKREKKRLFSIIHKSLTDTQKKMIVTVAKGEPEWIYGDWSRFPGIAWKLKNIEILKTNNPHKFNQQTENLATFLSNIS